MQKKSKKIGNRPQTMHSKVKIFTDVYILGLQPRDKVAMLVANTKETFLLNLRQNRVHSPAERNGFVLDPRHGRRDVTCKPAIAEWQVLPHSDRNVRKFALLLKRIYRSMSNFSSQTCYSKLNVRVIFIVFFVSQRLRLFIILSRNLALWNVVGD